MIVVPHQFTVYVAVLATLLVSSGCGKARRDPDDHPRLAANVVMRDVVFRSEALGRDMRYRVMLPASIGSTKQLPVAYLLHGAGTDFREWSNNSDVAQFAASGLVLVMPQGDYSYYVNAAERPRDRYEDYILHDLFSDVEARFPVARSRPGRAIAGVSMGGFGAIKIALSHPDLFTFVGALSPAIDVPRRSFSVRRIQQSWALRQIFGPWGSESRRRDDPFLLVREVPVSNAPYLFLGCGSAESLLEPNRRFATELASLHLPYEFHVMAGGHDWNQWNRQAPGLFERLLQRLRGRS